MLLDKPVSKNDTVTFKLLTGEEMIACFVEETTEQFVVEKPATIAQGPQGMGIIPWIISANANKVKLNKSAVIAYLATDTDVAKAYTQATTGIQLAT